MGSFRLARRLPSVSLLTDAWVGTTVTGRPIVAHARKEHWARSPDFAQRYAGALRGWQGLRQPGVVPLVEAGVDASGAVWIVEEFIEGETLRLLMNGALAQKAPLTLPEAVAVTLQAARGLLALNRLLPPLTHGDLSAATLIVAAEGEVRAGLVGVASAHAADATLGPARAEIFALAPEELAGGPGPTTDVFRLGLVFLEALTGRTLFAGATHADVKARVEKYPGLTAQHFPMLPAPVSGLLAAMLGKEPGARPGLADVEGALRAALQAVGGGDDAVAPVAGAFARLFRGRQPILKSVDGGEPLVLTPFALPSPASSPPTPQFGAANADGSVTLAKMSTKRVTSEEMAQVRAKEAADAARSAAAEWNGRHLRDEGNPRDFALGAQLIEQQRITPEQAEAALQQSQSFGATLFYSLCNTGALDEDEGLPFAADLLKQRYLTGPQLLALNLGPAQAPLLPRETAEQWQVVPLKVELGGLTVAIADPGRLDVLDDVKIRAKVRSVIAVRATDRTITEGLARVYDGKTEPPEWGRPKAKAPQALEAGPPPARELAAPLDLQGLGLAPLNDLSLPPPPGLTDYGTPAAPPALSPPAAPPQVPALAPLPPMPSAPAAARAPMSSPPMSRPLPAAPPAAAPAPPPPQTMPNLLDILSRLFDALLSLVPERGPEGSQLIAFVRNVAKQSGATGIPLEHVRLCAKAVVIAALLEGKRAFETPSLPAVSAVFGAHWKEFEPLLKPLLDGDEAPAGDPRAIVLSLTFAIALRHGAVPLKLAPVSPVIDALRSGYPPAAVAAVEAVLSR